MVRALHHRGPDSHDMWASADGALALGHNRLAIVDLSEHGRQPMASRSGRYVVVFNGEIYNHLDLRQELGDASGWRGHSDTETLLQAVERWGVRKTLEKCVGMFAIALWDAQERTLTLARDRMGEKPLYYGQGAGAIGFASELKALRHCPGLDFSIDPAAIGSFLQFGYVTGTQSAFTGVRKLPPGTFATLRSPVDPVSPQAYWTLPEPTAVEAEPNKADEEHLLSELDALLLRSVKQQMLSDVPLGAFLSGGIDSSLIVALMQRGASQPVRTFSMGVADSNDDESKHARRIAEHLGTSHTEMMVRPEDVLATAQEMASIYDEPFADPSQVPTVLLSRLTRQHVTVALSGDAGDELFGGYNRHLTAARLSAFMTGWPHPVRRAMGTAMEAVPVWVWGGLAAAARAGGMRRVPPGLDEKLSRLARFIAADDGRSAYLSTLAIWLNDTRSPLKTRLPAADLRTCAPGVPLAQQMMWWDMQSYLPDDILVKVDRAAMSASLETRVPLLDHRLVEFSLRVPLAYKIRDGSTKWLLRELLARYVPRNLFERPKQGFTVPLGQWLREPLRAWAESLLSRPALFSDFGLDRARLQFLWKEHLSGQRNHQRALWSVLMLQAWMEAMQTNVQGARWPAVAEPLDSHHQCIATSLEPRASSQPPSS